MVNKYLIILYFIWCFILTGCNTEKHTTIPQIKDYVCRGEYDLNHVSEPFIVDPHGNFYLTDHTIDSRMNIEKYNSQGKYITGWVPEIKKRKKNCWFTERKNRPVEETLTDIFADKEYVYIAYTAAYLMEYLGDEHDPTCYIDDYTSHIEQFDLNGKFITSMRPKRDTWYNNYLRFITKDKNGNFYLAFWEHIEKYDANWNFQSDIYPFVQKWYGRKAYLEYYSYSIGDVAVDSEGYIYILLGSYMTEYSLLKGHIVKFDSSGKLIKERIPEDKGEPSCWGLEIDPDNNIFILEIMNETYRIEKFDSNLNFVTTWEFLGGSMGGGSFNAGIRIDSAGNVYVDTGKGTIKKFSPKQ